MYHFPNPETAQDCRIPLDSQRYQVLTSLLSLNQVDLDIFLPQPTLAICDTIMTSLGGFPTRFPQDQVQSPYLVQFMQLRARLLDYDNSSQLPQLELLPSTRGSLEQIKETLRSQGVSVDEIERFCIGEQAQVINQSEEDEEEILSI